MNRAKLIKAGDVIMSTIEQLKTQYIKGIYETKALLIKEEAFTLQSGKKSHLYLNHRHFLSKALYLSLIATIYSEFAKSMVGDYVLGAVDSIMSPIIVGAMSILLNRDYVVIRNVSMSHGTQEAIYGEIKHPILLVDDMTSTGGTLIEAAKLIRARGGVVSFGIISAYREESAIKNLKQHGIEPICIASFKEIIDFLYPQLSQREKEIVSHYPLIMD